MMIHFDDNSKYSKKAEIALVRAIGAAMLPHVERYIKKYDLDYYFELLGDTNPKIKKTCCIWILDEGKLFAYRKNCSRKNCSRRTAIINYSERKVLFIYNIHNSYPRFVDNQIIIIIHNTYNDQVNQVNQVFIFDIEREYATAVGSYIRYRYSSSLGSSQRVSSFISEENLQQIRYSFDIDWREYIRCFKADNIEQMREAIGHAEGAKMPRVISGLREELRKYDYITSPPVSYIVGNIVILLVSDEDGAFYHVFGACILREKHICKVESDVGDYISVVGSRVYFTNMRGDVATHWYIDV